MSVSNIEWLKIFTELFSQECTGVYIHKQNMFLIFVCAYIITQLECTKINLNIQ